MLADQEPIAFVATQDAARAKDFYQNVLGLRLISDEEYALVFALGSITLRIQKAGPFKPQQFTTLGWVVPDIRATIRELKKKGVEPLRYDYMPADDYGVWNAGPAEIAWFKDPDGNVLSLTSFA